MRLVEARLASTEKQTYNEAGSVKPAAESIPARRCRARARLARHQACRREYCRRIDRGARSKGPRMSQSRAKHQGPRPKGVASSIKGQDPSQSRSRAKTQGCGLVPLVPLASCASCAVAVTSCSLVVVCLVSTFWREARVPRAGLPRPRGPGECLSIPEGRAACSAAAC